ncbi:RHS repeat-associated core domain-containing protein [Pseudomonas sp. 6D_7.1_Bac1]|uniref:RHS repeat-associated core domain-containing protein n=1 Tax=Pseudomonas sp. 6D_7.1_Bac1 TaxID=2971615 RepID=UPI0021CA0BFB|nr:RHS repeat-associated core domain-containing protein [Pseudomonas sp. 6D_7.1_Bac1]MCU1752682.1 RHS repeat protein [Pseudomonas sp. 6D_7.1_Bac1]
MNTLIFRVGLLALALGGTLVTVPFWQAPERGWSFTYNAEGLIEFSDGPRTDVNDITRYEYDAKGHLIRVINPLGHITELSNFDFMGNPQTLVDPNGVSTTLTYAPQGWLTSVSTANASTRFEHNAVGDITKLIRGDGSWLTYTWDDARRLTRITNSLEERVEFDVDPMGNRTATRLKDSAGNLTKQHRWVYDELGRLLHSVGAAGQTRRLQYDLNDNPTTSTNPRNDSSSSAYDPLDRLVKNTDPLNGTTRFEYDAQDNLTHVNDPRGVNTRYQYDGLGNLTHLVSPDSGTNTYKHDAAGNITQKTDAGGVVTLFTYDALNRLTARRYPAKPQLDTQFHYDAMAEGNKGIGRLTGVEDSNGVLSYTYDEQGNLTGQRHLLTTNEVARSDYLGYRYDGANRLIRIDYPTGFSIDYLRDSAGQVSQVHMRVGADEPIGFASNLAYLPFGPLKSLTWTNGATLERSYDQDYRLTAQTVVGWSNLYDYDANGNITQIQSSLLGELNYSYDALDRLTEDANASQQQTFSYDAVGNRTDKTLTPLIEGQVQGSAVTTYQYGASNNRLIQIDGQSVSSDAAGNLIQDRADRQLIYDEQNRLSSVKSGDLTLAEFRYNALGQRTQKVTPQGVTAFLYGPSGQLLGETLFDIDGKKLTSQYYVWLDGLPLGGVSVNYDATGALASSTPFYIHSDHLNTPRIATNASQHTVWQWKSDAFGAGEASGSLTLNLRFPGQYYDAESGLYYNYFRDYDPETGRYVQSDPIGLSGGLNTYAYVEGNPLKYVDPTGQSALLIPGAEAGAAAGTFVCPGVGTVVGGVIGAGVGAGLGWYLGDRLFNESTDEGRADHAAGRKDDAKSDAGRQVGDKNKVIENGKVYDDSDTGHTVHVDRDRVVIIDNQGRPVTQFKNTRANTNSRVNSGKWIPR